MQKLKGYAKDVVIMVFSAEWCKDCGANLPTLALFVEKTDMKVRVFGRLKTDPLDPKEKWRIPPFSKRSKNIHRSDPSHTIVFDKQGK